MNRNDIVLQPMETRTIFVRKANKVEAIITENTASAKLGFCPRIASLVKVGSYQRAPEIIFKLSAKVLTMINPIPTYVNYLK